jgi:hypothetical protein
VSRHFRWFDTAIFPEHPSRTTGEEALDHTTTNAGLGQEKQKKRISKGYKMAKIFMTRTLTQKRKMGGVVLFF